MEHYQYVFLVRPVNLEIAGLAKIISTTQLPAYEKFFGDYEEECNCIYGIDKA